MLDGLPVHRARSVRDWLGEHRAKIEVSYLPSYSPGLDPDEGLNADPKRAATRKAPARNEPQLEQAAIGDMREPSQSPARIRSYFRHKPVRYAARPKTMRAGSITSLRPRDCWRCTCLGTPRRSTPR